LEEARAFQQSLLPAETRRIEGVSVCARYLPCSELGGDFFDYAAAGKGRASVLVADVSGHGAAAAMLTGIVKAAFHSAQSEKYEPLAVVSRIAEGIRSLADNMMVTGVCARLSSHEPRIEYVNAGHPPGILFRRDGTHSVLESTGPLISPAFPEARWVQQTLPLEATDRLLLYTDGLVEAQGEGDEFGLDRLVALARRPEAGGPALLGDLLSSLMTHLGGRPPSDDVTLLEARLG
jgi:sigma-B regulation protein RsbU (phosphoserine phosphatase)